MGNASRIRTSFGFTALNARKGSTLALMLIEWLRTSRASPKFQLLSWVSHSIRQQMPVNAFSFTQPYRELWSIFVTGLCHRPFVASRPLSQASCHKPLHWRSYVATSEAVSRHSIVDLWPTEIVFVKLFSLLTVFFINVIFWLINGSLSRKLFSKQVLFIEFFVEWKANRIFTLFAFSEPLRQRLYVRRGRWSARTYSITNPDQFPDSGIQRVAQQAWVSESYRISLKSHGTLIGVSEESHLGFIEVSSKFLQWRIFTKESSLKNFH